MHSDSSLHGVLPQWRQQAWTTAVRTVHPQRKQAAGMLFYRTLLLTIAAEYILTTIMRECKKSKA